jgi:hypothetical protein
MPGALAIISETMLAFQSSGLTDAASEMYCCFNGNEQAIAKSLCPSKAQIIMHGMDSFAENLTLVEIEKWAKTHPDWYVFYGHAKGATHVPASDYAQFAGRWRRCMLKKNVHEWRNAVNILGQGYDAVGCHFLHHMCDGTQHYFAGNYWWANSNFLRNLPSIYARERIKVSGIASPESRYEAEVWIGNGGVPYVKDLETTHGFAGCP